MKGLFVAALAIFVGACSGAAPSKSEKEAATAALQNEAAALKRDGEKMNPALGVTATWTITAVDVQEQPGNATEPLTGTIKFRINSQTRESTGVVENNFERSFKYGYNPAIRQWMLKP